MPTDTLQPRLRSLFSDLAEFTRYVQRVPDILRKLGFTSPQAAWKANPIMSTTTESVRSKIDRLFERRQPRVRGTDSFATGLIGNMEDLNVTVEYRWESNDHGSADITVTSVTDRDGRELILHLDEENLDALRDQALERWKFYRQAHEEPYDERI